MLLVFGLLSRRDQILLLGVAIASIFLSLLDLFGVMLVGAITSLALRGISSFKPGDRVTELLESFGIGNLEIERQILVLGVAAAGLLILKTLASIFLINKTLHIMARRGANLSSSLVEKFLSSPLTQIQSKSPHKNIFALTNGVSLIMLGIIGATITLSTDFILLLVMTGGLFILDPVTAFGSTILFAGVAASLHRNMSTKATEIGSLLSQVEIESSKKIYEVVSAYREILVRGRRKFISNEIGKLRHIYARGQAQLSFMTNLSKYILEISLVISALLLAFYQLQVTSALRAAATIVVFVAASTRIIPAILRMQQGFLSIKMASAQARPTLELIEDVSKFDLSETLSSPFSSIHKDFRAIIEISKVSFSYEESNLVLNNVDLVVNEGEFIAIVGASGAGKTTLLDVMIGIRTPSKGKVRISGQDPHSVFERWPGAVAYVPQDCPIIDGTIKENLGIGFSDTEISDDLCWESLRYAQLLDFVSQLPEGLKTQVGDRGTKLSGGQKQRLGIARALITNPKILIMDEATSALDGVTEMEVSEQLKSLQHKMTLIVIAHRFSTILGADRIYFMRDGSIQGSGTFLELKKSNIEFQKLAKYAGL